MFRPGSAGVSVNAGAREPVVMVSQATYRGTRSRCTDFAWMQFTPLRDGEATEAALKQSAPGNRVIHLAAGGFLLEEGCRANAALRENPLLRVDLVLAAAKRRHSVGPDGEVRGQSRSLWPVEDGAAAPG